MAWSKRTPRKPRSNKNVGELTAIRNAGYVLCEQRFLQAECYATKREKRLRATVCLSDRAAVQRHGRINQQVRALAHWLHVHAYASTRACRSGSFRWGIRSPRTLYKYSRHGFYPALPELGLSAVRVTRHNLSREGRGNDAIWRFDVGVSGSACSMEKDLSIVIPVNEIPLRRWSSFQS